MSATVSYANVAAKGESHPEEKEVVSEQEVTIESVQEGEDVKDVKEGDAASPAAPVAAVGEGEGEVTEGANANASGAAEKKKSLAPAPVPTKSAWGASVATGATSVDESKWPTPDKVVAAQNTQQHQKFIKPITNKWVPITAKVVLPSAKPASKVQNRNRKNKKPQQQQQPQQQKKASQIKKKSEDDDEVSTDTASAGAAAASLGGAAAEGDDTKSKSKRNPTQHQNYKPRFQAQANQNQFFQPQPFNPYNNRQFRPQNGGPNGQQQNGQFRPKNYNYRNGQFNGGYPTGFIPQQQVQIPPPISPKQDPQQALIQQINYYFSLENLIRDLYLRKNMLPEGGWVPLSLILEFKRVKIIINGIQNSSEEGVETNDIVLDSVTKCDNLEVRYAEGKSAGDAKIEDVELRVKDNYEQWLLPQQ